MRSKDKVRIINEALDENQTLSIRSDERMGGTVYATSNWMKVGRALELLINENLIVDYAGSDVERFLCETLAEFPYAEEQSIQSDQYHQIADHLNSYTGELPRVVRLLDHLYPSFSKDAEDRTVSEFAVELDIVGHGSIDETRDKFERISMLFGTYLTLNQQVTVKGFDQGSDWVVFEVANGLPVDFIILTLGCAREVMDALAIMPRELMSLAVNAVVNMMPSSENGGSLDRERATSDALKSHFDHLKQTAIDKMTTDLKEKHPEQESLLNEGREKAGHAVDQIIGLHNDGVTFQIPEGDAANYSFQITGDNNTIVLGQGGPVYLPAANQDTVGSDEPDIVESHSDTDD